MSASILSIGEKMVDNCIKNRRKVEHTLLIICLGDWKALSEQEELHLIELQRVISTAVILLWKVSLSRGQLGVFLLFVDYMACLDSRYLYSSPRMFLILIKNSWADL